MYTKRPTSSSIEHAIIAISPYISTERRSADITDAIHVGAGATLAHIYISAPTDDSVPAGVSDVDNFVGGQLAARRVGRRIILSAAQSNCDTQLSRSGRRRLRVAELPAISGPPARRTRNCLLYNYTGTLMPAAAAAADRPCRHSASLSSVKSQC